MQVVVFEDQQYSNLLPLVYFRPVWDLRCGAFTIAEKFEKILGQPLLKSCRNYLLETAVNVDECIDVDQNEETLWVNGRWLIDEDQVTPLFELTSGEVLCSKETVLAFRVSPAAIRNYLHRGVLDTSAIIENNHPQDISAKIIHYLWDAVNQNGSEILHDWQRTYPKKKPQLQNLQAVHLVNPEMISIAASARIKPGAVLDAEHGPVWIDEGAVVMANAVLEGPVYVGCNSVIKIGAKIYENTTIGPLCKVGGEIEGSIIWGYSNKQHDGFLGHAYLGAWVNLGADTNNSDLKNNYGQVTVMVNGKAVNSGSRFVGLLMGDHSKTAINTMFNTGTVVGVSCNVFGAGMPPKFIPSFSWGGAENISAYDFKKAVSVAKTVMARRKIPFSEPEEKLFTEVRKLSSQIENKL